jgi:adenylate cyclase
LERTIVGNFGGSHFFEYTAYGDTINVAARLVASNKRLGTSICVSGDVAARCQGFVGRAIGAEGRSEPIHALEPQTGRPDGVVRSYENGWKAARGEPWY